MPKTTRSISIERSVRVCLLAAMLLGPAVSLRALASDAVLNWIAIMNNTISSGGTTPLATTRVVAHVSASMFDAVNGIDPDYEPLIVKPAAPRHASQSAAAVQAAYAMLIKFYPAATGTLTPLRDASIAAIKGQSAKAIQDGMAWGQTVADAVWANRLTDGVAPPPPPFVGVLGIESSPAAVGAWRPTPTANAPGAGPQFATTTPWVLERPSQFRPGPPNALTSAEYAADYNEVKQMGVETGSGRTADQSELALFWNWNTPLYWNNIALQVSSERSLSLTENAHLFALLNVAMADAGIACWDAKYRYVFWRPVTAIRGGDTDNNPGTDPDPAWTPWLDTAGGTPAHPEYPSGHSTVSGAAAAVLASMFGDDTPVTVTSGTRPGTRSFPSFSAVTAEIADARVFGGIHFRTSCVRGNALGQAVAGYVMSHAMRHRD
jgi:membrane-associated phospholipid phosphatase